MSLEILNLSLKNSPNSDFVKAPAVKPCIVYITLLPCSVGSKELSAYRLLFAPIGLYHIVG